MGHSDTMLCFDTNTMNFTQVVLVLNCCILRNPKAIYNEDVIVAREIDRDE